MSSRPSLVFFNWKKNMYILRRTNQGGGYVSKEGRQTSYITNLAYARKFRTIEEAQKHQCILNEVIEDLEKVLDFVRH